MTEIIVLVLLCTLAVGIFSLVQKRQTRTGSKNGMLRAQDLGRKPKPAQRNSTKADVQNLLVYLLRYAKKHPELRVVCPGRVEYAGRQCGATMLLVGPFGVQSIRCFGFGGAVGPADSGSDWVQTMNGATKTIMNPVQANSEDNALLRQVLKANGYREVPVYSCGVFTQEAVQLNTSPASSLYTVSQFKAWLESDALAQRGTYTEAVQPITDLLARLAGIGEKAAK